MLFVSFLLLLLWLLGVFLGLVLIVWSTCVYGVLKKNASLLWPAIAMSVITFVATIVSEIGLLALSFVASVSAKQSIDHKISDRVHVNLDNFAVVLLVIMAVVAVAALQWHITLVLYSLQLSIRQNSYKTVKSIATVKYEA